MSEKRTMELKSFLESNSLLQTNFKVSKVIAMSDNFPRKSSRNYIDRNLMKNDGQERTMFINIVTSNYVFSTDFVIKALRGGKVTSKDECLLYNEELGINEWVNFNKVAKGDLNTYIQKYLIKATIEHNDYVKQKQEDDKKQKEQDKVNQQGIKQLRSKIENLERQNAVLDSEVKVLNYKLNDMEEDTRYLQKVMYDLEQKKKEKETFTDAVMTILKNMYDFSEEDIKAVEDLANILSQSCE